MEVSESKTNAILKRAVTVFAIGSIAVCCVLLAVELLRLYLIKNREFVAIPEHLKFDEKKGVLKKYFGFNRLYEPTTVKFFQDILKPGWYCVDCGANEGYFSVIAADLVKPHGKVFAIEPSPVNVDLLTETIKLNHMEDIVQILPIGAGHKNETMDFYDCSMNRMISRFGSRVWMCPPSMTKKIQVPVMRLEEAIDLEGRNDRVLVKIDAENFEEQVLSGCSSWLDRNYIWVVEMFYWKKSGKRIVQLFESKGYKIGFIPFELVGLADVAVPIRWRKPSGTYIVNAIFVPKIYINE